MKDVAQGSRWPIAAIFLGTVCGVNAGALGFGTAVAYAKSVQSKHPYRLPVIDLDLHAGPWSLALCAGCSFLLGVVSAACIYYAEWAIRGVARGYELRCGKRLVDSVVHPEFRAWRGLFNSASPAAVLTRMAVGDCRETGIAVAALLRNFLPVLTLIWAIGTLLYFNPVLTGALGLVSAAYFVPFFLINRNLVRTAEMYGAEQSAMRQDVRGGFSYLLDTSGPPSLAATIFQGMYFSGAASRSMDFYDARLLAKAKLNLVGGLFFAISLLMALFLGAGASMEQSAASLLIYLVALRFVWASMRQVASNIATVTKHLPSIRRLHVFHQHAARLSACPEKRSSIHFGISQQLDVPLEKPKLRNSCREFAFRRGSPLLVLSPAPAKRHTAAEIASRLLAGLADQFGDILPDVHAGPKLLPSSCRISDVLAIADAGQMKALYAALQRMNVANEVFEDAATSQPVLRSTAYRDLSPEARYAVSGAHCFLSSPELLLLDFAKLDSLSDAFQSAFLAELSRSFIAVVATHPRMALMKKSEALSSRIEQVVVMDEKAARGCGTLQWLEMNIEAVERLAQWADAEDGPLGDQLEDEDWDADAL